MNFERGQNPKDAMDLGYTGKVKKWFDKNNTARATHQAKDSGGNNITVNVQGSLVLERFSADLIEGIPDDIEVGIGEVSGTTTILNLHSNQQVYERIKAFYNRVLDDCLGKTTNEQSVYLFGVDTNRIIKDGEIEKSEELIRTLPQIPTDIKLIEVANHIISNKLEYAHAAKDESSVQMCQYAKEVLKKTNDATIS